jgi:hypothetical protein
MDTNRQTFEPLISNHRKVFPYYAVEGRGDGLCNHHFLHASWYGQSAHIQDGWGMKTLFSMPARTALAILAKRLRWDASADVDIPESIPTLVYHAPCADDGSMKSVLLKGEPCHEKNAVERYHR